MSAPSGLPAVGDPDDVAKALETHGYLADEGLATVVFLALRLRRPLFLEGEAGVGKTEVAKVLARWLGGELLRLQCYDGIDVSQAVYEWDYSRQLLHLRAAEARGEQAAGAAAAGAGAAAAGAGAAAAGAGAAAAGAGADIEDELYSERFLVERPLLRAITASSRPDAAPVVLLIDELDRADDEFEAYLLEILADYAVTVPELGTFRATQPPIVVVTSNRTRDVHDALKRRCLYHWVEHPDFEREVRIVQLRVPEAASLLVRQVAAAVGELRGSGLYKVPGVAETIDWAQALATLGATELDARLVDRTLGSVLKYREDAERVRRAGIELLVHNAVTKAPS